jgi:hypothetical protein
MASTPEWRAAGLLASRRQTEIALKSYYENPNYCLQCGKLIEVKEGWSPTQARRKKFCDKVCAARYNNKGRNRHANHQNPRSTYEAEGPCLHCGKPVYYKKRYDDANIYYKRDYCEECRPYMRDRLNKKVNNYPTTRQSSGYCTTCGEEIQFVERTNRPGAYYLRRWCDECTKKEAKESLRQYNRENGNGFPKPIEEMTKGELRALKTNQGWYSFKATITKHARDTYAASDKPQKCVICGFDFAFHVCHIHPLAKFPDDATIGEINHINNLVGLCPNHHIMFDSGAIELPEEY